MRALTDGTFDICSDGRGWTWSDEQRVAGPFSTRKGAFAAYLLMLAARKS